MGATSYRTEDKPDLWWPRDEVDSHRFALGRVGDATADAPPLLAICMNPSHADHSQSDRTIDRLIVASRKARAGGWLMLNLYPERATDASRLGDYDQRLSERNCEAIRTAVTEHDVQEVLLAWGNLKHPTLRRAKLDVLSVLAQLDVRLFTMGRLNDSGDPQHPLPRRGVLELAEPRHYVVWNGQRLTDASTAHLP